MYVDDSRLFALIVNHLYCGHLLSLQGLKGMKGDMGNTGDPGARGLPGKKVRRKLLFIPAWIMCLMEKLCEGAGTCDILIH